MYVKAPMCLDCKHFHEEEETIFACAAFPKGIPLPITYNRVKHTEPYPGDNGIQFEEKFSDENFNKGGPGSGNFGHAGRPGEVGGSAPTGTATVDPGAPTQEATDEQKVEQQAILDLKNRYGVTARHARMLHALETHVITKAGKEWDAEGYWLALDTYAKMDDIPADMVGLYKQSQIESVFLTYKNQLPEDVFAEMSIFSSIERGYQEEVSLIKMDWTPPTELDRDTLVTIGIGQTAHGYWHDDTTFYKIPKEEYQDQTHKEVAIYEAFKNRMPMLPAAMNDGALAIDLWAVPTTVSMSPYIPGMITGYDSIGEAMLQGLSEDMRSRALLMDLGIFNVDRHFGNVGSDLSGNMMLIDSAFSLDYEHFDKNPDIDPIAVFSRSAFWKTADDAFKITKIDRRHIDYIVEGLKAIEGYDTTPGQALLNDIPEGTTWQQFFSKYLRERYG